MNAITYSLSGRMGNQLQLFACARTLSLRYDWRFIYRPLVYDHRFKLCESFTLSTKDRLDSFLVERVLALHPKVKPQISRRHRVTWYLTNLFRRVVYLDDTTWDVTHGMFGQLADEYQRMRDTLFVLRFEGIFRNLGKYRDELLKEILPARVSLRDEPIGASDVGIHIRRGDTDYGMPMRYYVAAVHQAQQRLGRMITLHLFSDVDHELLARELCDDIPDAKIIIHRGEALEDMMSLARYPNLILSQSWFSYWSALFSEALVFVPPDFRYYPEWQPVTF